MSVEEATYLAVMFRSQWAPGLGICGIRWLVVAFLTDKMWRFCAVT